jgi:hypothetical protein
MDKDNIRISQSLLKALTKYASKKECGLVIEAQYIDRMETPSTPAQALGNWFEYKCTGALPPYNPVVPEPKVLKSGKLAVAYERMLHQVQNFKNAVDYYNVKIEKAGFDMKFNNITGTADVLAEVDGKKVIIDIKTTALFDDKWNEYGWNTEHLSGSFRPKVGLLVQAVHYKWLYKNIYGENPDFYFWVFSTQNSHDFKIIKVNVDDDLFEEHAQDVKYGLDYLKHSIENGFKAYPSISKCAKCFLRENCNAKIIVPTVSQVSFGLDEKNFGDPL